MIPDKKPDPVITCHDCNGTGVRKLYEGSWFGKTELKCGTCNGKGRVRASKLYRLRR